MSSASIDVQARDACVLGGEVWLAKQQGGIAVYSAATRCKLQDLPLPIDGKAVSQVRCLASTYNELWAATTDGELLCVDGTSYKMVTSLRVVGVEKKAALPALSFSTVQEGGTGLLAVASATGRVFLVNPFTRKVALTLSTYAPCTAVEQCAGTMIVAGDEDGSLYVWDLATAGPSQSDGESEDEPTTTAVQPTLLNQASTSKVRHLLFEPVTEALWVARENGNLDVYRFNVHGAGGLVLEKRAEAVGCITALQAVGGKVVASTYDKRLVTLSAETATVVEVQHAVHRSFIHSLVKVTRTESAQLWSLGNDEAARPWEVTGLAQPAVRPPRLTRHAQALLASSTFASLLSGNAALGVSAQRAKAAAVEAAESLRKAREEAQEMRLRVMTLGASIVAQNKEVADQRARVKEVEAANAKLTKDVIDITSRSNDAERERSLLQADLGRARDDLTLARTDTSNRSVEKSKVDEELSRQKTEKLVLEQRLWETESRLATVQAENARLCQSMGSVATAKSAEKEVQQRILQSSAQASKDLDDARQLNRVLSSVVASMEYTIRRHEEEGKDLAALLNAYRRKVADHVTDPFLSALLVATMVRNPARFDLECDDATKGVLLDRNGPFIQFVHSLRQTDPEAYEQLIRYLQLCAEPGGDASIPAGSRLLLDKFVALAAQEGTLGADAIQALKRSIPATVSAASPTGGVSGVGTAAGAAALGLAGLAGTTTTGTSAGAGSPMSVAAWSGSPVRGVMAPSPLAGSAPLPGTQGTVGGVPFPGAEMKPEEDFVGAALLRELRSQRAVEDSYVKEQRAMFEFILKTRRALVECLALLQKRTMSAQQVVEALSANVAAAGLSAGGSVTVSPTAGGRLLPLQSVFLGIIRELVELTSSVVSQYLTNSEKQRLNVQ